jgi:hypothetical protein
VASSNLSSYEYSPLPGPECIQLLRIHAYKFGRRLSNIYGSPRIYSLANAPKYTTLAYSWGRNKDGDASLCRRLILDGCLLNITENLYDFLVQMLHVPGSADLLWIDAVCINQNNNTERNAQVSLMAHIYTMASDLIIWLGEDHTRATDLEEFTALSAVPQLESALAETVS